MTSDATSKRERTRGYMEAMEDVMSYINSLDSGDMSPKKVRSLITAFCTTARPKGYLNDE